MRKRIGTGAPMRRAESPGASRSPACERLLFLLHRRVRHVVPLGGVTAQAREVACDALLHPAFGQEIDRELALANAFA